MSVIQQEADTHPADPAAVVMATADKHSCQDYLFNLTLNENKYLLTAAIFRILSCRVRIKNNKFVQKGTFP